MQENAESKIHGCVKCNNKYMYHMSSLEYVLTFRQVTFKLNDDRLIPKIEFGKYTFQLINLNGGRFYKNEEIMRV